MPPPAEVLSDGKHPIVLWGIDDCSEPIARSEAGESQGSSEPHDESTPSATGDEQTPESSPARNRSSSDLQRLEPNSCLTNRRQELEDSRAVRTARRNLRSDFGGCASDPSEEARNHNDEGPDVILSSESEYTSSSSTCSTESHFDHQDHQAGLAGAGEHFMNCDGPAGFLDINDESGLEDSNGGQTSQTKASAAVVAPFRDGGLPSLPRLRRQLKDPSDVTDFGESLYSRAKRTRSRKSSPSNSPRDGGQRRTKKPKKTLQDRLFRALVPTHEGEKEFFPRKVLSTIVNRQCVYEELSKHLADSHSEDTIEQYAKKICDKTEYEDENGVRKTACFRKIFVILVLIDKTPAITKFLEIGLSDRDLPLQYVQRADKEGSKELRLSRDPGKRLKCFSKQWKQLHIRNFETYQWTTISPFFAKGGHKQVSFYKLKDQTILPFVSINQENRRSNGRTLEFEGGFSRVVKVDIHPDHHNFDGDDEKSKNRSFAVKCLHSRDREQFDKEAEMLKRFSDPSVPAHKHLISLLATYQQFGTFFLIFHWADADLRRYWKDVNPNPVMDRRTVLWVAQQCKGIAEGVCAIHQYSSSRLRPQPKDEVFGHHGDIKPENVLWFPDANRDQTKQGTLKLSDFGLAEMSMHQTRSMQPKSNYATSLSYQAPEAEIEGTGAIGRSYDIWTLGCLYLEFITWLMGGWDLVDEFFFLRIPNDVVLGQDGTTCYALKPAPTFYVLKPVKIPEGMWKTSAEIKPAVSKFISRLLADASCTDFLRNFIEMIRDDLLVIKANDRQKQDGDRDRATSQEHLSFLYKKSIHEVASFADDCATGDY
ncbi:kinase-like protein [Cadophora sp. DSE1049]|nr:kinase-like protein [Cadophora sp. DSE1049]